MTLWMLLVEPRIRSRQSEDPVTGIAAIPRIRNAAIVAIGLVMSFPLAGMQLIPTARLAGLASNQRDFNYLSSVCNNAAAPGELRSPGFISPVAALASPGVDAVSHLARRATGVCRAGPALSGHHGDECGKLEAIQPFGFWHCSLSRLSWLSLGPFVPGFHELIRLPGFSFFRAPRGGAWRRRWLSLCWRARGSMACEPGPLPAVP